MRRGLFVLFALALGACQRHVEVASLEVLPEPRCDDAAASAPLDPALAERATTLVAVEGALFVAGTTESFAVTPRACGWVVSTRIQRGPGYAEAEVTFDAAWVPLVAELRRGRVGTAALERRFYELRTEPLGIRVQRADQTVRHERLLASLSLKDRLGDEASSSVPRAAAVIGPGRGLLTAWIRRAGLEVGQKSRDWVLDFSQEFEVLRRVTLRREPNQTVEGLGEVAVYTVYGREPVFADEQGRVVGDLAGLRAAPAPQSLRSAPHD